MNYLKIKIIKQVAWIIVNNLTVKLYKKQHGVYNMEQLYLEVELWISTVFNKSFNLDAIFVYQLNKMLAAYNLKLTPYFCKLELPIAICDSVTRQLIGKDQFFDTLGRNINKLVDTISDIT